MRGLIVLLALVGCNKEQPSDPEGDDDDDDSEAPECVEDPDCPRNNICEEGACLPGDRDNSFEEATALPLGEELAVAGVINPAGDVDTYVYDSPGAEWVSIRTIVAEESPADTVVSLYNADREIQASIDNYQTYPFSVNGYDSVLYAYLPDAGPFYVTVEDRTSFFEDLNPAGGRTFDYSVLVRSANGSSEPDSAANPSLSIDIADGSTITVVGIVIDEPGDSDYVTIDFPFTDRLLEVWGAAGVVGSSASPLVRILDGETVVAEKTGLADGTLSSDGVFVDQWLSWFRASEGTFVIEATDAGGGGASDAWFPLFVRTYETDDSHPFFGTNVYEAEREPNDEPATATALVPDPEGADYEAFRMDGAIDLAGESDWFSFAPFNGGSGGTTTVRCWTDRFGSLALLDVELLQDGESFAAGTTGDDEDYYVVGATIPGAGPILLRVIGNGDGFGAASWYRCAAFVYP